MCTALFLPAKLQLFHKPARGGAKIFFFKGLQRGFGKARNTLAGLVLHNSKFIQICCSVNNIIHFYDSISIFDPILFLNMKER